MGARSQMYRITASHLFMALFLFSQLFFPLERASASAIPPPLLFPSSHALSPHASAFDCGNATISPKAGFRNVLLIGDSISMAPPYTPGGYGAVARQILESRSPPIYVQHAGGWYGGGQASNTVKGLYCTSAASPNNYLNVSGRFDVVHFNYGLHDLVSCNNTGECDEHVALPAYGTNLVTIATRLGQIAEKVVFATTTPVPNITTSLGRSYQLAVDYNARALTVLQPLTLHTDDLWGAMISVCGKGYTTCALQLPRNVHLSPEGQQVLGRHVADFIVGLLGEP